MKKASIISVIIVLGVVIYFGYQSKILSESKTSLDPKEQFFAELKKSCIIFDFKNNPPKVYQEETTGLSFSYSETSVVCERRNPNDFGKKEKEISVFSDEEFKNNKLTHPLVLIYIDYEDLESLPQPIVISEEKIMIDGVEAVFKKVKPSFCESDDCPEFTTISIQKNNHSIEIQLWDNDKAFIESLSFKD
ncbi:MAG: hypothetical protein RLZZ230_582 [Candidatus Parcubacteria bacterium]|jgi:hypothetical protein